MTTTMKAGNTISIDTMEKNTSQACKIWNPYTGLRADAKIRVVSYLDQEGFHRLRQSHVHVVHVPRKPLKHFDNVIVTSLMVDRANLRQATASVYHVVALKIRIAQLSAA